MDIAELNKILANMQTTLNEIKSSQASIEGKLTTVVERLEKNEGEIKELRSEFAELKARMNVMYQEKKIDHFRLTGFPPMPAEKPSKTDQMDLLKKIMRLAGVQVAATDFVFWDMVPNKTNSASSITGKFVSHTKREEAFNAFREKAKTVPILWSNVVVVKAGDPAGQKKMFMRSQLTRETLALLNEAKKYQGSHFAFVWEKDGRILTRKKKDDRPMEIFSAGQLQRMVDSMT